MMSKLFPDLTRPKNEIVFLLSGFVAALTAIVQLLDGADFSTSDGVTSFAILLMGFIQRANAWGPETTPAEIAEWARQTGTP